MSELRRQTRGKSLPLHSSVLTARRTPYEVDTSIHSFLLKWNEKQWSFSVYTGFRDNSTGYEYPNAVLRLKRSAGTAVRLCERINVALAVVKALLPEITRGEIGISDKGEVRVWYAFPDRPGFTGTVLRGTKE